jgi:hypothetical protein
VGTGTKRTYRCRNANEIYIRCDVQRDRHVDINRRNGGLAAYWHVSRVTSERGGTYCQDQGISANSSAWDSSHTGSTRSQSGRSPRWQHRPPVPGYAY